MPAHGRAIAAALCALMLASVPAASAAPHFGRATTFGSTRPGISHFGFFGEGRQGLVAALAERDVYLAPFGAGRFGHLHRIRLRQPGPEFGLVPAVLPDGSAWIPDVVHRHGYRFEAVRVDRRGRRRGGQMLGERAKQAAGHLSANARGDTLARVFDALRRQKLYLARAGHRFRRIPSPPKGVAELPSVDIGPDGSLVAIYTRFTRVQVARRSPGGRWSRARTVYRDSVKEPVFGEVQFAPSGAAVLLIGADTGFSPSLHVAWARRGRPFGPARQVVDNGATFLDFIISLDRRNRATLSWIDLRTEERSPADQNTFHVWRAPFGGRFRHVWDTVRPHYVPSVGAEPVPGGGTVVVWQETPGDGRPTTLREAVVRGGKRSERVLARPGAGEGLGSFRMRTVAGHVALVWLESRLNAHGSPTRVIFRGAVLRR